MLTAGDTLILLPNRQEVKVLQVLLDSRAVETALAGTQFTCFTGTKVQILTPEELPDDARLPFAQPLLHLRDARRHWLRCSLALLVQKYSLAGTKVLAYWYLAYWYQRTCLLVQKGKY